MNCCIRLYHCIQIVEKSFNDFLMVRVIPAVITGSPAIQILAQYTCINHYGDIGMPGFLVFPLIGGNAMINNVLVNTLASCINTASVKALASVKDKVALVEKKKLMRRRVWACSVLKVKFGSNFIDRGTPLVMQNFCMSQTVSLSLITGKDTRR